MPINYSRTNDGGISANPTPEGSNIDAAKTGSIRNPSSKALVFRDDGEFGSHEEIDILGQKLVSASQDGESVTLLDISNPLDPELLDKWGPDEYSDITDVVIFGERAAVPAKNDAGNNGVVFLDISNPQNVAVDSEIFDSGYGEFSKIGISPIVDSVSGSMAVVVSEGSGLRLFDSSNTSEIASEDPGIGSKAKSIEIFDEYVYVSVLNAVGPLYQLKKTPVVSGNSLVATMTDSGNALHTLPDPDAGSNGKNFYSVNENGFVAYASVPKKIGDVDGTATAEKSSINLFKEVDTSADILRAADIDRRHLVSGGDKLLVHDISTGIPMKTDEHNPKFEIHAVKNTNNLTIAAGNGMAIYI